MDKKTYDIIIQAQKPHKWTGCTYITPEFCDQCGSMLFYLSEGLKCQGTDTKQKNQRKKLHIQNHLIIRTVYITVYYAYIKYLLLK